MVCMQAAGRAAMDRQAAGGTCRSKDGGGRVAAELAAEKQDDIVGAFQAGFGQGELHRLLRQFRLRAVAGDQAGRRLHTVLPR